MGVKKGNTSPTTNEFKSPTPFFSRLKIERLDFSNLSFLNKHELKSKSNNAKNDFDLIQAKSKDVNPYVDKGIYYTRVIVDNISFSSRYCEPDIRWIAWRRRAACTNKYMLMKRNINI
jgi:hypothetical protein